MNRYEELLCEADNAGISVDENFSFNGQLSGLYIDGNIALSDKLKTTTEKACVLAEELGHHETSVGNILDMNDVWNRKQERQARLNGYQRLIGLVQLIKAYEYGCQSRYEIAEYLNVTEVYLQECIDCYRDKYGVSVRVGEYGIIFIPHLAICKTV